MATGTRGNTKKRPKDGADLAGDSTKDEGTAAQLKDKAGDAALQVRERAEDAAPKVRQKAIQKADEKVSTLVDQGRDVKNEADKIAQQLREDGKQRPAELLEQATDGLDTAIGYLESHSVEEVLGELGRKGRENPLAAIGAAFGLGFAVTRLLKATGDGNRAGRGIPAGSRGYSSSGFHGPEDTASQYGGGGTATRADTRPLTGSRG